MADMGTGSPFRIAAYRAASSTIARLDRPVAAIVSDLFASFGVGLSPTLWPARSTAE